MYLFPPNIIDILFTIIKSSLSITFFVLAMMLFIEYINVRTCGIFCKNIRRSGWQQIVIGVLLGVIPGCLGTYTIVTLYSHNLVSLGALFATFVATMGDEAFLLFSLDLKTALLITCILVVIAIITGFLIDAFHTSKNEVADIPHFEIHNSDEIHESVKLSNIISNIKNSSPHRAILLFGIVLLFVLSLMGELGHSHDFMPIDIDHEHEEHHMDWFSITFMLISLISAFIISIVSEHFLENHFWNHIIKKHFFKIFGWTFFIIALVHILNQFVVFQDIVMEYRLQILIVAILVGLIPESGPHIIFISLFLGQHIPFSILLANSLVQDGHGGLPLFAESKLTFVFIKALKAVLAFAIGIVCMYFDI